MSVNQDIWPDIAIHPGETVADLIEQRGLTQAKVAELMGRPPQVINEIVRGKKNITAETAVGLEAVLDMPAQFWTNLQAIYDNTRSYRGANETWSAGPAPKFVPIQRTR